MEHIKLDNIITKEPFISFFKKDKENVILYNYIKKNGYYNDFPIQVIPDGDNYIVIDGHQRLNAMNKLKAESIPCEILCMDEESAIDYLRESQLIRREVL